MFSTTVNPCHLWLDLFLKQRLRELFGVEGLQIVQLLAEADEFDGQPEFLLDRHHHAAFARAVELGHDEAGERDGFVEFARLVQRIHAGAAVEYEQDFVRRTGQLLIDALQASPHREIEIAPRRSKMPVRAVKL